MPFQAAAGRLADSSQSRPAYLIKETVMLSIGLAIGFAIILACLILISQKVDRSQLTELRATSPLRKIQIICGDCSGNEGQPRRTFVDRMGRCEECGGSSYVLASISFARPQRRGNISLSGPRVATQRVARFDGSLTQTKKIAV